MNAHISFRTFFTAGKLVMLVIALLFSCRGKDGDIGPAGADGKPGAMGLQGRQGFEGHEGKSASLGFENGSIKGTIKGIRRDGQLFEENFEFKLANKRENFSEANMILSSGNTIHNLDFYRFSSLQESFREENNVNIQLLIENKGQASQRISISNFRVNFIKLLTDQNLFVFETFANFYPDEETVLPMSQANNATYHFADYGRVNQYVYDNATNQAYIEFTDQNGNKVYFKPQEENSAVYKFAFINSTAGLKVTSSLYNGLRVKRSYSDEFIFFNTSYEDLSEKITVPADKQEISNFNYNPASGLVTFNYTITVDQFRNENTSRNQVEITGSVKANIYNNGVMREGIE